VNEWIDSRIEKPKDHAHSQMRWLMRELADLCMELSVGNGESEDQLCERLAAAYNILSLAWYSVAPDYATAWRRSEEAELDADEKNRIAIARHTLWKRHDPKRAFSEGWESEHYTAISRESLEEVIADYFEHPELRHPTFDWIFLDMTVSRELSAFGEEIKKQFLPGRRDPLLQVHERYFPAKGNLKQMSQGSWSEFGERLWVKFFWFLLAPLGAVWAAFYFGYEALGWSVLGLWSASATGYISVKLVRGCWRIICRIAGRPDPRQKPFELWDQMYEVWKRLEGPVVNPSLVREAMLKSTQAGAVWDAVSWSLLDRVVATDPAIWVVQPRKKPS
jgi:hypothetical protein